MFSKREVGLRNAIPWTVKGLKAHLKGDRIENALPLMVEGSKAHSKEVRNTEIFQVA